MLLPMAIENYIIKLYEQMRQWRHHLHQFPETAYEEKKTAKFIADKLAGFGLEVYQGFSKTGVIATLSAGNSNKKIALRADMDALFIQEMNNFPYKSCHDGKMHACGHDGHSTMLLGAASYLAEYRNFNGTVYFIFQPAEEGRGGAKQMIDDGLFDKFPADCVFGMHNFPDIPSGHFAVKSGAIMASRDSFEIIIAGKATHAAMPHLGDDVIVASAQLIIAMQTIVSRTLNPADSAVVSVTEIQTGNAWNALPETVVIRGTFRCFHHAVQNIISKKITCLTNAICQGAGLSAEIKFNPENPGSPVTINSKTETKLALQAAIAVAGIDGVDQYPVPSMSSEDFSYMLQEKPGCYIWIGNGASENSCLLHNPHYDFNDEILPTGVAYWIKLVETVLSE